MQREFQNKYYFSSKEYGKLAPYFAVGIYEYICHNNKSLEKLLDFESVKNFKYGSESSEKLVVSYQDKKVIELIEKHIEDFLCLIKLHEKKLMNNFSKIEESSEIYTELQKAIFQSQKRKFSQL